MKVPACSGSSASLGHNDSQIAQKTILMDQFKAGQCTDNKVLCSMFWAFVKPVESPGSRLLSLLATCFSSLLPRCHSQSN
jgi:hypothetical protein